MIKKKVVNEDGDKNLIRVELIENPNRNVHPKPTKFKKYAEGALYMGTIYGVLYGIPALLISGVGYGVYRIVKN